MGTQATLLFLSEESLDGSQRYKDMHGLVEERLKAALQLERLGRSTQRMDFRGIRVHSSEDACPQQVH